MESSSDRLLTVIGKIHIGHFALLGRLTELAHANTTHEHPTHWYTLDALKSTLTSKVKRCSEPGSWIIPVRAKYLIKARVKVNDSVGFKSKSFGNLAARGRPDRTTARD